jgi:hypothetical protein
MWIDYRKRLFDVYKFIWTESLFLKERIEILTAHDKTILQDHIRPTKAGILLKIVNNF